MQPRLYLFIALLALGCCRGASNFDVPAWPAVVGVLKTADLPFYTMDPAGNETGLEVPLRETLCELARLNCTVVQLDSLQDRIDALKNGSVDFVIAQLSVTYDRLTEIDYARPFYYSEGVSMFAPDASIDYLESAGGWDVLKGRPVCVEEGYYATGALERNYGIVPVPAGSPRELLARLAGGECDVIAHDSSSRAFARAEGVGQVSGVEPVLVSPLGVGVAKGSEGLADRLAAALVRIMQVGDVSPLLEWEQEYLLDEGLPANTQLQNTISAITYFEPCPQVEGEQFGR